MATMLDKPYPSLSTGFHLTFQALGPGAQLQRDEAELFLGFSGVLLHVSLAGPICSISYGVEISP